VEEILKMINDDDLDLAMVSSQGAPVGQPDRRFVSSIVFSLLEDTRVDDPEAVPHIQPTSPESRLS